MDPFHLPTQLIGAPAVKILVSWTVMGAVAKNLYSIVVGIQILEWPTKISIGVKNPVQSRESVWTKKVLYPSYLATAMGYNLPMDSLSAPGK